jgi:hypothetical protein
VERDVGHQFTCAGNIHADDTDNPKLPVLPRGTTGARTWDYNMDGGAHYGMFAEFVRDVRMEPAQQGMTGKDWLMTTVAGAFMSPNGR